MRRFINIAHKRQSQSEGPKKHDEWVANWTKALICICFHKDKDNDAAKHYIHHEGERYQIKHYRFLLSLQRSTSVIKAKLYQKVNIAYTSRYDSQQNHPRSPSRSRWR